MHPVFTTQLGGQTTGCHVISLKPKKRNLTDPCWLPFEMIASTASDLDFGEALLSGNCPSLAQKN
jgi:hypothetical protein